MLAVGSAMWALLLPFAEKPWREEQYGEHYETCCERVPRSIEWETLGRPMRR